MSLALGGDGSHDLDIEHDLAIGILRVAGVGARLVPAAVNRHRDDLRSGQAEAAKVLLELLHSEAAAIGLVQFDDPDDLATAIAVREIVDRRQVVRIE